MFCLGTQEHLCFFVVFCLGTQENHWCLYCFSRFYHVVSFVTYAYVHAYHAFVHHLHTHNGPYLSENQRSHVHRVRSRWDAGVPELDHGLYCVTYLGIAMRSY